MLYYITILTVFIDKLKCILLVRARLFNTNCFIVFIERQAVLINT